MNGQTRRTGLSAAGRRWRNRHEPRRSTATARRRYRQWIMVDCGVTFPGPDLPGVDLVLPDIRFLAEERKNLKGIIITHAHEDHYGALADLWPGLNVPVYASPFTAGMLEAKRNFETDAAAKCRSRSSRQGDTGSMSVRSSIEAVGVNHSIPEPMSLDHPHAARQHRPYRRLEDRPRAFAGPADRRGALPPARRRGRAGADVR